MTKREAESRGYDGKQKRTDRAQAGQGTRLPAALRPPHPYPVTLTWQARPSPTTSDNGIVCRVRQKECHSKYVTICDNLQCVELPGIVPHLGLVGGTSRRRLNHALGERVGLCGNFSPYMRERRRIVSNTYHSSLSAAERVRPPATITLP
jgi:hypothetical protein